MTVTDSSDLLKPILARLEALIKPDRGMLSHRVVVPRREEPFLLLKATIKGKTRRYVVEDCDDGGLPTAVREITTSERKRLGRLHRSSRFRSTKERKKRTGDVPKDGGTANE